MKFLGMLLIFVGCTITGFWYANRCESRIHQLQTGIFLLKRLQREVVYASSLLEASKELEAHCESPYREFFQGLQREISLDEGKSLEQIWSESGKVLKHSALQEKEIQSWILLGSQFNSLDRQTQHNSLERLIEQWQDTLKDGKNEWAKKKHLYPSLGVIGGAMLCILLL